VPWAAEAFAVQASCLAPGRVRLSLSAGIHLLNVLNNVLC
jgi:hypothetical protein